MARPTTTGRAGSEICVSENLNEQTQMVTTVRLGTAGQLSATSRAINLGEPGGFVGVLLLLYGTGRRPQWLWNTNPIRYGLDPAGVGGAEVSVTFSLHVDPAVVSSSRHLAIKQFCCPSVDAWSHIKP